MIICVGLAADETFLHMLMALKRAQVEFEVLDMAQLAYSGEVRIPLSDLRSTIIRLHEKNYQFEAYDGAWIRLVDISSEAPSEKLKDHSFGLYVALSRLFNSIPIRVVNPPLKDFSNFSKLFHTITLAPLLGWRTPRSCLTNNENRAQRFIKSCKRDVIFKGASAVKTWVTLYEPKKHARRLALLKRSPVLFQERIDGPDVRVHVIGEHTFGESIKSPNIDYRTVRNNKYVDIEIPPRIAEGCYRLTQILSAPFLGIDFKIDRSTQNWFFLEANSMPAYQGYDKRKGGAISQSIINWLLARDD